MSALREAFVDELKDLLDAEVQLLKALPKMAKAAQNERLRIAFEEHQEETAQQIRRLGRVFEAFQEPGRAKKCKGMKGLIDEADELIKKHEGDAALIASAQKAEHYEIAAYGTLISWAIALGHDEVVQVLNETLAEEKAADKKLTVLAQTVVNAQDSLKDPEQKPAPARPRRTAKPRARRSASPRRQTSLRSTRNSRATRTRETKAPRSKRLRTAKG